MKVAKKNFLTLKCTKISDHLSREQQGPSPEMFNTRLEESLKKYTTGNNLLLAERWTECCKRDFLSLMFTFYDSHLCFSFITGREKSIKVIGSGTAYLISIELCFWCTPAIFSSTSCIFPHTLGASLLPQVKPSQHWMNVPHSSLQPSQKVCKTLRKKTSKMHGFGGRKKLMSEGSKGEVKQQRHKWSMQNMRKGRRKMHRVGKVGIAYVQKRKGFSGQDFPYP